MGIKLIKTNLIAENLKVNALAFVPEFSTPEEVKSMALFTHGYTSHKGSLLTWASRLAEEGLPTMIFDIPGHYLGSFNEVKNFEEFKDHTPLLFEKAYDFMSNEVQQLSHVSKIILGGHSLGALLSLKAIQTEFFMNKETLTICVGLGTLEQGKTHLFETPFYKSTLNLRGQLVAEALAPEFVFPWIREEKHNLQVSGKRVHLISGEDDLVVGKNGAEIIFEKLTSLGNNVSLDKPKKLPHHLPEQTASFIKKFLKQEGLL